MFGSSKQTAQNITPKTLNLFAEGTHIKGDIKTTNDIRIDGIIEGTVTSDSKVVIGPSGKVKGDIICQNADISGSVVGTIEIGELLFLKSTANVEGDITTEKLVIEAGAKFNGLCTMGQKHMNPHQNRSEKKRSFNESFKKYSQYSTLGFQMLFVILVGVLAGKQLDKYFSNEKSWFTVFFSLFSVVASLVWIIVKLIKSENNK
jgi:cytoskeletal protein CcmA (bactofilin family)